MGKALEILLLAFWSGIKFLYAAPPVLASGYNVWETMLITIAGGWLGVVIFYYFGGWVTGMMVKLIEKTFLKRKKPKRKFTRKNRFIVKTKNNYGLLGLVVITPSGISIPIGCIVASRYFRKDKRTVPLLFVSVAVWGIILSFAWSLTGL